MQQLLLKNASEDNTVKPHSSDAAASSSYLQAFLELIDFGPLILRILLDPVGSLYANYLMCSQQGSGGETDSLRRMAALIFPAKSFSSLVVSGSLTSTPFLASLKIR